MPDVPIAAELFHTTMPLVMKSYYERIDLDHLDPEPLDHTASYESTPTGLLHSNVCPMYMNESTFVAFVPIIVHRGQPVVFEPVVLFESCLNRQTRLDYKFVSFLQHLDMSLAPDLDVPSASTYSLLHILPSYRSGMNPDHDRKDSVYPTVYMFNSLVISDVPLVQTRPKDNYF